MSKTHDSYRSIDAVWLVLSKPNNIKRLCYVKDDSKKLNSRARGMVLKAAQTNHIKLTNRNKDDAVMNICYRIRHEEF